MIPDFLLNSASQQIKKPLNFLNNVGEHMTLGQKIKQFRIQKGLSQFELELEISTSYGRISKIESGKINPDKETIVAISNVLRLETSEIASLFGIELVSIDKLLNDL